MKSTFIEQRNVTILNTTAEYLILVKKKRVLKIISYNLTGNNKRAKEYNRIKNIQMKQTVL